MDEPDPATFRTSASLLERLKDPADRTSWQRFHDTYAGLLFAVARRAGLGEADAQDAVQETLIDVAQQIRAFRYDRVRGRFKNWLLTILSRRIGRNFRKRHYKRDGVELPREERLGTALEGGLAQPEPEIEAAWEDEWHRHIYEKALDELRAAAKPMHYQIFQLHVIGGLGVREVCARLGVRAAEVYWAKFRLGQRLKRAVEKLDAGAV